MPFSSPFLSVPSLSQVLVFAAAPCLGCLATEQQAVGKGTSSNLGRAPGSLLQAGSTLTSGRELFTLLMILLGAYVRCHPRIPGPTSQRPEPDLFDVWGPVDTAWSLGWRVALPPSV